MRRSPLRTLALLLVVGCGGGAPAPVPAPAPGTDLPADVRAALDAARAVVEGAREDAAAWAELGVLYEANGLLPLAEPCYVEASRLDPADARSAYHLARLCAGRGAYEEALAAVAATTREAPRYGPAHWRSGHWLVMLGRLDEARTAFARAAEVDPQNPAGRWGLAEVALERGDASAALEALAPLDRGARDFAYTHHLRAGALRRLGELERAAAEAARGGEPLWGDPWKSDVDARRGGFHGALARARAAAERREFDAALRTLQEMLAQEPDNVNVNGMLSDVLVAAGRPEEAVALLLAARERIPDHYRMAFNLAIAYERAGDDERALAELDECLRLHPTLGLAHLRRARLLTRGGDDAGALAALSEARRVGERGPELWRMLGVLHARAQRWSEAGESFDAALRAQPAAPVARMAAEAHARAGARERAWQAFALAERLDPDHTELPRLRELVVAAVGEVDG